MLCLSWLESSDELLSASLMEVEVEVLAARNRVLPLSEAIVEDWVEDVVRVDEFVPALLLLPAAAAAAVTPEPPL